MLGRLKIWKNWAIYARQRSTTPAYLTTTVPSTRSTFPFVPVENLDKSTVVMDLIQAILDEEMGIAKRDRPQLGLNCLRDTVHMLLTEHVISEPDYDDDGRSAAGPGPAPRSSQHQPASQSRRACEATPDLSLLSPTGSGRRIRSAAVAEHGVTPIRGWRANLYE